MNIEELRDHCISKKSVEECFPFDEETLVFKVQGKMFLLVDIESKPLSFNAKCDPAKAEMLREKFDCVSPGFHMNKTHWNTVVCDGSVSQKMLKEWIDHSYEMVVKNLPKSKQKEL